MISFDIHAQLSNHIVALQAIRSQHPVGPCVLDSRTVEKINNVNKFLKEHVRLIEDKETSLPLLKDLYNTIDQFQVEEPQEEKEEGPLEINGAKKAVEDLKKRIGVCIQNCEPFQRFAPELMSSIATFLHRPDVRTLEQFSEIHNAFPTVLMVNEAELFAGIKFDPTQPIPDLMKLFVHEFVEDYRAMPEGPRREMKMIEKAYRFLRHASLEQQEEFFSVFFSRNRHGDPEFPEYPLILATILRELPNMEGFRCLNLKPLAQLPAETLKRLVQELTMGPVLNTVQHLSFNNVSDAAISDILSNPYITSNLETLEVLFAKMSDPIIGSLNQMPNLKTLKWVDPTIEEYKWDFIINNLKPVNLEQFSFESESLKLEQNVRTLGRFLCYGQMANLKHLCVFFTSIDPDMISLLLSQTQFPKLEVLEFWNRKVPLASIEILAQNPRLETIKSLTFDDLDLAALQVLVSSPYLHPEFTLNLVENFRNKRYFQLLREQNPNITIKAIKRP